MPATSIDDAVLRRLAGVFAAVPAFEHRLVRTSWFDEDVLWLAPEDEAPFRSLTGSVHREFPDYPPFGGLYEDVVPHLTIADRCPLEEMKSAGHLVEQHLPISCIATGVSLVVQGGTSGRWTRSTSFALGTVPLRARAMP